MEKAPQGLAVYVSASSGSDGNDGRTPSTPKRTIAAGAAMLRHGAPDWLLLKRGDIFRGETLGQWKKSGSSSTDRMVLSSYGVGERPIVDTGRSGAMWTNGGGGSPETIDYLALIGIDFIPGAYDGRGECVGLQFLQPGSHLLIDDCGLRGYSTNLVLQGWGGRLRNVRIRRCLVADAATVHEAGGGHPQGLYAWGVDGLSIRDCVFTHNGWSRFLPDTGGADIFSHNLYIDNGCTEVQVVGNLIADASSHGLQLRCGGLVEGNLFLRNPIHCLVGGGNAPEAEGVPCFVSENVFLEGRDIDAATPRGIALWVSNVSSGLVNRNLAARSRGGSAPQMLVIDGKHVGDGGSESWIRDLVLDSNDWIDWGGSVRVEGTRLERVVLSGNGLQNLGGPLVQHEREDSARAITSTLNRFHSPDPPASWFLVGDTPLSLTAWASLVSDRGSVAVPPVSIPEVVSNVDKFLGHAAGPRRLFWNSARTGIARRVLKPARG